MRKLSPEELTRRQPKARRQPRLPVYLILDSIRSLWNVGSIFRSADGAGIAKIFLCGYTGRPPRAEISKTALGAENAVPWEGLEDPGKAIAILKRERVPVYVLEHTDASTPLWDAALTFPLGLVIGNEIDGVSSRVVAQADGALEIPMYGVKESLNVAVACGIALYEMARRSRPRV